MKNLGFDIDDVIFKASEALKEVLDKCDDEEILQHKLEIMRGEAVTEKIGDFLKANVVPTIKIAKPMQNAAEVIRKFRRHSNRIILITARGDKRFPGSEIITWDLLEKYGIECDAIIFNCVDKVKACKDNNISVFVDDSPKNCLEVRENLGIPVIGFESEINREEMAKNHIRVVSSWDELEEAINKA